MLRKQRLVVTVDSCEPQPVIPFAYFENNHHWVVLWDGICDIDQKTDHSLNSTIGGRHALMMEESPYWARTVVADISAWVQYKKSDGEWLQLNEIIRLTCNIGFMPPKKSKTLVLRLLIESSFWGNWTGEQYRNRKLTLWNHARTTRYLWISMAVGYNLPWGWGFKFNLNLFFEIQANV